MDTAYFETESSLQIIKDRSVRRKLASASAQIERATANLTLTPEEILGNAQDALFNIEKNVVGERYKISSAQELAVSFFEAITAPKQKLPNLGWYALDNILNGIRPCLYLVAGGTGMGKTSFMMAMAKQLMTNHNLPVIYFTPEMTAHQLTLRMIGSLSGINYAEIEKIGLKSTRFSMECIKYCY
jgi:replicative DNA helicase